MWTFFWRWATWKVFDANPEEPAGIVSLITPKAYLTSESYAGMRRYLRETADEGWIIDLSPEGFQPSVPTRIFPGVQQPICIGVFARFGPPDRNSPAHIHHTTVIGSQQEKFSQLLALRTADTSWRDVPNGWEEPFQPVAPGWTSYPRLADLFPWQQPGVKPNRRWVYAPDKATLRLRWSMLVQANGDRKIQLFKETRDRSLGRIFLTHSGVPSGERPLLEETREDPLIVPIAYRCFDRQYLIHDRRVIDFPRAELWQVAGDAQVYMVELHTHVITDGPALTFSAFVPDNDYFLGHHGGRVLPLYRNQEKKEPNVAPRLLYSLSNFVGTRISAMDLLAYVAALIAHPGYTRRFRQELTAPGIRLPITIDAELWKEAVEIGSEVLWLHTYGERYHDEAAGRPRAAPLLPEGQRPVPKKPIPTSDGDMPDKIKYMAATNTLIVGEDTPIGRAGRIEQVPPAVWEYTVGGGVPVVRKWFSYRQQNRRQKNDALALDDINPTRWTAQFDDELLALLNVLGRCVALEPRQADLLERVCASTLVTVTDLEREGVLPVDSACSRPPRQAQPDGPPTLEG
jgi:hypothetical protein